MDSSVSPKYEIWFLHCAITFQLASSNSISEQLRSTLVPLVYTARHQYWVWVQMLVSDQIDALAALPLGKEPLYSLHRRLGGRQSRSGHCGGGINLSIDWEPNSDSIVVYLVALLLYLSGCLGCSTLYEGCWLLGLLRKVLEKKDSLYAQVFRSTVESSYCLNVEACFPRADLQIIRASVCLTHTRSSAIC
jgi:hypothetical protein